ncbi:UbiA family prenyltransferase [bacterium]|nr:UbiA family prenyltransferase [bacterium]
MRKRFLESIVTDAERAPYHWSVFALALLALIVARNLLEGALGPKGSVGFVYFSSPSALMVLDHFLFFYVSLFLGFYILLSALARERIASVMKVMTPAWIIILIPPLLDYIITSGEGMRITYLLDLRSVAFRFFNPTVALDRVSPGQRVEILAACLLAVAYIRIKSRSWFRAAAAFLLTYLLLLAHGILPNALAKLSWAVTEGANAPPTFIYNAMYRAGGIVPDESRKLALVFIFSSCALGWLVFKLHAPEKERALRSNMRPLRTLHYLGMAAFGLALGWAIFSPVGISFTGGGDVLGIIGVVLAVLLAFQASVNLNDLFDEESDRIVNARRPLVEGAVARRDVAIVAAVLTLGALLVALNVKYSTFLLMLLTLALSLAYSAPPIRLKRIPLISNLSLGLISLLVCMTGFSAFAEERAFALFPPRLAWLIVLSFGLGFAAKDIKDRKGDGATGVITLPVLLGERAGRIATAVLVLAGYVAVPVCLPYRALIAPALLLGIGSAVAVLLWKRPDLDRILLVVCLAFTLVIGITTVFNIDQVLPDHIPVVEAKAAEFAARHAEAWHDWTRAGSLYAMAAAVFTHDPDIQERAGSALFKSGNPARALPFLLSAVDLDPSRPVALQYLALTESRLGRLDSAVILMREAVRMAMRPRVFLSLLGDELAGSGDHLAASRAFSHALRAGQPDIPARLRLGEAFLAVGRMDEARAELRTAADRRPSSAQAHDALGKFYNVSREPNLAAEQFARAVELAPNEPVFWNNLGVAEREAGRFEQSLTALDNAGKLAPRMVDPYYNRGQVLERLGRDDAARREYLLALEIDPSFTPARAALHAIGSER